MQTEKTGRKLPSLYCYEVARCAGFMAGPAGGEVYDLRGILSDFLCEG